MMAGSVPWIATVGRRDLGLGTFRAQRTEFEAGLGFAA